MLHFLPVISIDVQYRKLDWEPPPDWCANCSRKFSKHLSPLYPTPPQYSVSFLPTVSLCWCLSHFHFPAIEKVKSRDDRNQVGISVFAGLGNRKRQAAAGALRQQNAERGGGSGRGTLPRPQDGCTTMAKASAGMKSHWQSEGIDGWTSEQLDVRMDEGRGEFNTDKQNERQRGIACWRMAPSAPTAIYLLLPEHPRIVCILQIFLPASAEGPGRFQLMYARLSLWTSLYSCPSQVHSLSPHNCIHSHSFNSNRVTDYFQ